MNADDNPYEYFTPPGVVGVSEAALTMARQFDEHVKRTISRDNWVVGFEWFTRKGSASSRRAMAGPWSGIGPRRLCPFRRPTGSTASPS